VWPEAIDPRLCFGYPRNRVHRVSNFLEIHRSEPHHRSPQTNLTTISPWTPPQQTSPPFETLIVRDHYAASIFNAKAIQIAPNRRMRVICHQHETPKHEWGAGTNQSSSTAAPLNLHRSNRIRPLRQQPLNCVGPHSSPSRTRTCWNEPTFLHRWRIATTSQQSGTEQWQPSVLFHPRPKPLLSMAILKIWRTLICYRPRLSDNRSIKALIGFGWIGTQGKRVRKIS